MNGGVAALDAGADLRAVAEVALDDRRSRAPPAASPFSGSRTRQTTSSPRSRSMRATCPPMNPVPPVRKTFIGAKPIALAPAPHQVRH